MQIHIKQNGLIWMNTHAKHCGSAGYPACYAFGCKPDHVQSNYSQGL